MSIQKSLPVITSILIILLVAFLRDKSRTAAAIFAVMPINMPLALWVVFGAGEYEQRTAADFMRNITIGLLVGVVWTIVVYILLRAGWSLVSSVLVAYVVWVAIMLGLFWTGWLTIAN
jgi:hypothetical protein